MKTLFNLFLILIVIFLVAPILLLTVGPVLAASIIVLIFGLCIVGILVAALIPSIVIIGIFTSFNTIGFKICQMFKRGKSEK